MSAYSSVNDILCDKPFRRWLESSRGISNPEESNLSSEQIEDLFEDYRDSLFDYDFND